MLKRLSLAIVVFGLSPAFAQSDAETGQADVGSVRPRIVLEEAPTTIKEAMERHQQQTAAADKALAECAAQHEKTKAEATAVAVGHLTQIAKRHAANGELPAASDAWLEVLRLDAENKDAQAFFRTIGRPDIIRARIGDIENQLVGEWKWCTGAEMELFRGGTRRIKIQDHIVKSKWRYDARRQLLILMDDQGEIAAEMKITRGGQMMEGTESTGNQVWGVRID